MAPKSDPHAQAQAALGQAQRAAKRGDLREAERWSKTAERMAAAAEKLGALPQAEEEDAEALRAELRARLRRLVEANDALNAWQRAKENYDAAMQAALANGLPLPEPLAPCPGGEAYMMRIASGEI